MNTSPVNLRNLEQIHESSNSRSPRIATLLLAATGATAVLVVGLAMRDRSPATEPKEKDPLAALVADAEREKKEEGDVQLKADELNFPDVLSDADSRTTALVAVRDKEGRLIPASEQGELEPPPATDRIPVVPLPAGTLLGSTSVTSDPKDELSQMAAQVAKVPDDAKLAPPGSEGGYVVQVASFKDQDDADQFVSDLRKRGHSAFRVAANVPGRGIWHRVRIGSFKTKYQAELYKKQLEETERTIALVIDPDKVERQEQVRAAKLAERIRKYGSE
jgi:cell division septation protein DedD